MKTKESFLLSSGVYVVVGTHGRVFDLLQRQSLRPDHTKMFVLDEADEMLSRDFKDQMRFAPAILWWLPSSSTLLNQTSLSVVKVVHYIRSTLHFTIVSKCFAKEKADANLIGIGDSQGRM